MLGQRYTTPIVTVVCPVTKLHHKASLQSASSCNCTSYAGILSLMYNKTQRRLRTATHFRYRPRTVGHGGMNNARRMNDLVAVRHMKLMKLNVLSIKTTAVHVVPPCERQN